MTSRFSIPLEALDSVHVGPEQQVSEQPAPGHPYDARLWGGALAPALADGAGGGGGGCGACGGDGD